jgi:hypothetical protein
MENETPTDATKRDVAQKIVDEWRNRHFNNVPTQTWNIFRQAEEHLVSAIEKHL